MQSIEDPNKLTKAQLRSALLELNVPLPPLSALKKVYVDKYLEHSKSKPSSAATTKSHTQKLVSDVEKMSPDSKAKYAKKVGIIQVAAESLSKPRRPSIARKKTSDSGIETDSPISLAPPKIKVKPTHRVQEVVESPKAMPQENLRTVLAVIFLVVFFSFVTIYRLYFSENLKESLHHLFGRLSEKSLYNQFLYTTHQITSKLSSV
eukprot:Sdes_comp10052_c0_seq1m1647